MVKIHLPMTDGMGGRAGQVNGAGPMGCCGCCDSGSLPCAANLRPRSEPRPPFMLSTTLTDSRTQQVR